MQQSLLIMPPFIKTRFEMTFIIPYTAGSNPKQNSLRFLLPTLPLEIDLLEKV